VPTVLAVYNWPKDSDRYRRIARFVDKLFAKWPTLQAPPFHPKWRDVNLAATIPGWTRFDAAEAALQRVRGQRAPSGDRRTSRVRAQQPRPSDQPQDSDQPPDNDP
jgi:hypothetical protein